MISLALICFFGSVYVLFAASKRVYYKKGAFSLFFEARPWLARSLSFICAAIGIFVLTNEIGMTNALLAGFVVWPVIASLVLLFAPIFKPSKVYLLLCFSVMVIVEFVIR